MHNHLNAPRGALMKILGVLQPCVRNHSKIFQIKLPNPNKNCLKLTPDPYSMPGLISRSHFD